MSIQEYPNSQAQAPHHQRLLPQQKKGHPSPSRLKQQIEEVILQVLKRGTDVKRVGKYYEKQQSKA